MRPSEIHKFCDATLRRTLEGLKSYYNDVKYWYVQKELTNDELEFLKLFKEEIEVRLKYQDQMRRWEMYGACVFTVKWSLDELVYGVPRDDPYQTNPPPDDIILSEKFNLAYYMAKRIEWVTKQARLILPYGMLLTCLFKFVMSESPELLNDSYVLYDRVMNPLIAQQERKTRKDCGTRRGRHSTSSSSAFDQPSSSHFNDDDVDENDEGTSPVSTPSPTRLVNSLTNKVPRFFQNPPNDPEMKPFYTRQIKIINRQVQLRDEHRGGLRSIRKGLRNLWRNMKK
ncbi:hypothetical protein Tco_0528750 [Tanacetum coccineum]